MLHTSYVTWLGQVGLVALSLTASPTIAARTVVITPEPHEAEQADMVTLV